MRRTIFTEDHNAFRESVRAFIAAEATPFVPEWDAAETVPPAFWRRAAQQGMIGFEIPERFCGPELDDFRFNAIVAEELARGNAPGDNFQLQSDIVAAYLCDLATEEEKSRWLPPFAAGELTFAICITEPGAGSDLRALTTTAHRVHSGYRLNGTKTFVTAGIQAGVAIVAAELTDATAGLKASHSCASRREPTGSPAGASWTRSAAAPRTRQSCSSTTSSSQKATGSVTKGGDPPTSSATSRASDSRSPSPQPRRPNTHSR
jgi:alkylation response protein AidB-like acyl-CoA dehydrogenase